MEVERMKALDAYEVREKQRAEERKRGAAVLMKQIEERAAERERQGLTLLHFSAHLDPCLTQENTIHTLNNP